jgi:hypothetical protein
MKEGVRGERKELRDKKLHNSFFLSNIISVIKTKMVR